MSFAPLKPKVLQLADVLMGPWSKQAREDRMILSRWEAANRDLPVYSWPEGAMYFETGRTDGKRVVLIAGRYKEGVTSADIAHQFLGAKGGRMLRFELGRFLIQVYK